MLSDTLNVKNIFMTQRKVERLIDLNKDILKYGIIAIICLLIGYGIRSSSINISEYQEQIDALKSQVSSLQDKLNEKLSLITDLQSQIQKRGETIQKLQLQLQEKEKTIRTLQTQLKEEKDTILQLQSQLAEKDRLVSSLQNRILDLEQQLNLKILGVYFSPKGQCEEQLLYWINRANTSIHILIYSFTLDSISDALIEAHNRGVDVKVVFEKQQITKYSEYQKLKAAGISVRNDTNPKLMHDKVMIVDGIIVITGSYNYSASAENYNNENMIIILSDYIAGIYEKEFEKIWNQSV